MGICPPPPLPHPLPRHPLPRPLTTSGQEELQRGLAAALTMIDDLRRDRVRWCGVSKHVCWVWRGEQRAPQWPWPPTLSPALRCPPCPFLAPGRPKVSAGVQ
jgi:hypothetical protein